MEASRQPGPDDASNERDGATFRARLRGIGKAFGATQAVLDADLDIRASEIHALLGENGAGKTTLMRVLAGILRPDEGSMEIDSEPAELRGRMDGAQRGIGLVQQHFGLIEEINGVQNYLLGHPRLGAWLHVDRARRELQRTAADLELEVDIDSPVSELTVGERQRLEILIALATGADVLILDEPSAALGSAEVQVLERVLRRRTGQGKSVVYITHKLPEVLAHVGAGGQLVDVRSPDEFNGVIMAPPGLPETAQRKGHVPGASNIPWATAVAADGTFKSADELHEVYGSRGIDPSQSVIAYCRIGERSSHSWFALKYLMGIETATNYDGSWTEYGSVVGVPIENPTA